MENVPRWWIMQVLFTNDFGEICSFLDNAGDPVDHGLSVRSLELTLWDPVGLSNVNLQPRVCRFEVRNQHFFWRVHLFTFGLIVTEIESWLSS